MSSRRVKGSAKGCWAREMKDAEKVRGTQENRVEKGDTTREGKAGDWDQEGGLQGVLGHCHI